VTSIVHRGSFQRRLERFFTLSSIVYRPKRWLAQAKGMFRLAATLTQQTAKSFSAGFYHGCLLGGGEAGFSGRQKVMNSVTL